MLPGADNPNRIGLLPNEESTKKSPSFTDGSYEINYLNCSIIALPPLMVLGAILYGVPLTMNTFILAIVWYFFNGLGITVGYHRLFSHRAFTVTSAWQKILGFMGAGAFQGSIKWWGRNHRIHHNYIDTDRDPYNAKRGFFYSHFGWMMMKQDYSVLGYVDISDFHNNKFVKFQHDNYFVIALISGIVLPTLIAGIGWGDWFGGYFYAALAKLVFVHHSTFFINSLAHTNLFGALQNFSENHTSHDSFLCSLLALGEGYHNFHHEFCNDYRNGIYWYQFDPSKWFIALLEFIGGARNLKRVPTSVIERNLITVKHEKASRTMEAMERKLNEMEKELTPEIKWTWAEIAEKVADGQKLLVVNNLVLDLERPVPTGRGYFHKNTDINWVKQHPGGYKIMKEYLGKDATEAMTTLVHKHSEGAFNLLRHLCVASLTTDE